MNFEKLKNEDINQAAELVNVSFQDSVASTLSEEGIRAFKSGMTAEAISKRLLMGNIFIACKREDKIVGLGELRDSNHLNLLFVNPSLQKIGIGREIFNRLLEVVSSNHITVNSSLNSVGAYKKLGFCENGVTNEIKGIKFQPMVFKKLTKT